MNLCHIWLSFDNFTIGYLWLVLCALMYALSVVYLSYETRKDHCSEAFKYLLLPNNTTGSL